MRKTSVRMITQGAIIAALYVVLTIIANALGLANHVIQVRFSEALCILPVFSFAAVPGLAIGCVIANLFTGAALWDIIFGGLATLLGALGTFALRKYKYIMVIPPILTNMLIIPLVLRYGYGYSWEWNGVDWSIPYFALTVGIGEFISVGILGSILRKVLVPYKTIIFDKQSK